MERSGRRAFLRAAAPVVGGLWLGHHAPHSVHASAETRSTVIGWSQAGTPLTIYHLGRGRTRVFLLGGQHGAPEANAAYLVWRLLNYFIENPRALPSRLGLDVMFAGNPDGLASGSRQYLSGVDPNRNWGGSDWQTDAYDSNGQFRPGLGGPAPFSEPETRDLANWVLTRRPAFVVNYHSAGGFVSNFREGPADDLAYAYAFASDYPRATPDMNPFSYVVTGSMDEWLPEIGIANLLVELTTPVDEELERNLEGVRAALELLAEGVSSPTR